jgi:hypothetical protein
MDGVVAEAIVDRDHDCPGAVGHVATEVVGLGHVDVVVHEAAAVDPHQTHSWVTLLSRWAEDANPHRPVGAGNVAFLGVDLRQVRLPEGCIEGSSPFPDIRLVGNAWSGHPLDEVETGAVEGVELRC